MSKETELFKATIKMFGIKKEANLLKTEADSLMEEGTHIALRGLTVENDDTKEVVVNRLDAIDVRMKEINTRLIAIKEESKLMFDEQVFNDELRNLTNFSKN